MGRIARTNSFALQPYWKCLYGEVFRQDPTPTLLKHAYFIVYILLHLPVIFAETFGKFLFHFPDSYFSFDETFLSDHRDANLLWRILKLICLTTGLSYTSIFVSFTLTAAVFTVLIWTDAKTKLRPFPWPEVWETDNNACYNDMFCEPTRQNRLIRRPGNTLSNFVYLQLGFMILMSTLSHGLPRGNNLDEPPMIYGLLLSDFIFGVMLIILSVSSIIWHSCNAMVS